MEHYQKMFVLGIFVVIFSWFTFTLYQFAKGITGQIVYFTDVLGSVGLSFKTTAGLMDACNGCIRPFQKSYQALEP